MTVAAALNEVTAKNGMVVESDLNPTWVPEPSDQPDLNSLAKDAIAEIEAEFAKADYDEAMVSPDGEIPAEESPEVPAEDAAPADEDEDFDPKQLRMFERVAQREQAASEREKAALAAEAKAKAAVEELNSLRGLKSTKELSDMFDLDPKGALVAMGKDPETMIRLLMADTIPADQLPESLKKFKEGYSTQREIAALKAKLAQQEQVRQYQEYVNTVTSGAREYVTKSVGDSTPTLAIVAKANPERALREIMEEISQDARSRAASDPNGEHLPYQEAAARVEKRMAEWKAMFEVKNGTPGTAASQAQKPTEKLPPQSKPPQKPLAPWAKKSDDIYEQGIAEAVREFHRSEATRKGLRR